FVALALTFGHVLIVDALSQSDETVGIPVAAGCGGTEADSGCATGSGGHGRSLRARCARILGGSRSGFLDDGSRSLSLLDRFLGSGNGGRHRLSGVGILSRCGSGAAGLEFLHTLFGGGELLTQLVVLLVETADLDDDLVKEIVDFILVVPVAELHMLEPLV